MTKLLTLTAAVWMLGVAHAPPEKFIAVDLEPYANQKIKDNFGSGVDGNDLAALLQSGRTFEGVNFKFGTGVVQLGSKLVKKENTPSKVEGIKVGKTCAKLHILHATGWYDDDGTKVAEYRIRYDDGTMVSIPVVYGEDVRDWFFNEESKGVTRGKVAWKGNNARAKELGNQIRLYLTTWENPHSAKKIATIDFVKTAAADGIVAPFCVAITLEAK
jgi:hypothetical protein